MKHTKETKLKMSEAAKKRIGNKNPFFGKKHSLKTRKIISEVQKGKHRSPRTEFKKGQTAGENHWCWKGGITKKRGYFAFMEHRRRDRKRGNGGSHTFQEWENMKIQYDFTCPSCERSEPEIKLTEDHIIPLSKGGSDNVENIQPLCVSCNSKKHDKIY